MPAKRLPEFANLDQLKTQSKDLLREYRKGEMAAFQRVREFHPKFSKVKDEDMMLASFTLSDAQLCIAREYAYASWPRLKAVVQKKLHEELDLSYADRLPDGPFKQAVEYMDTGDETGLRQQLKRFPDLISQRAAFEGGNYFLEPKLLEFLPQNPTRRDSLPDNALAIAGILLEAGAADDIDTLNETLVLTASGRLCREYGVQEPLLRVLCRHGADPTSGMHCALLHLEFEAARTLLDCGATLDLPSAATLGEDEAVRRLLKVATEEQLQLALSMVANTKQARMVGILINAGADPNRYNPPGGHSHCTPLHSAVASERLETVVALVEHGAELDIKDIHHGMTPLKWAEYLKYKEIADFLRDRL